LLMPESGHFRVEHKQSSELQTVLAEEAICSELRKLQLTRKNTGNFCSAESGSPKSISAGKYQRDGKNENGPGEGPAFANKIENGFECFL
jgi:hypothetical protein